MTSCAHSCVAAARHQTGLNLIEVMVAVVVLSLGLLGMGALMGLSVRNTQSANHHSQATNLAYEMIDMARANFRERVLYDSDVYTNPAVCAAEEAPRSLTACGTTRPCDEARWARDLCYRLPNGRGLVSLTQPGGGSSFRIQVDICWTDNRSVEMAPTATCSDADDDGLVDNLLTTNENKLRIVSEL